MKLGVVAIGRNEGERLRACLASALRDCPIVVYVDSGSRDGSVQLAHSMGAIVVELDSAIPFTASRARNEGFAKLPADVDFVQFVDGDCELVLNWIGIASAAIQARASTAIVCGRRREKFPRASIYNHLCDMEWDTPIGNAQACGGDFLIRAAAFREIGGFDPNVIAGEEPEMCFRLREKKWSIERLDAEMTLHDAAMTRLSQWWKRNIRSGHAYAQGYAMHGGPPEFWRRRQVSSIRSTAVILPLVTAGATTFCLIADPHYVWLGLDFLLLYLFLVVKIAVHRIGRGNAAGEAVLYALAVVLGKFPQYLGIAKFRSAQRHGGRYTIIEYKGPTRPVAQTAHDSRN